ncbi:Uncharacterised protein [Prevotella disiens]|uniref:Uncharacterized protein n=1 Tax=Prevotella disiens TaxID=28130 RepID=A0A379DY50_9BACT|nr:Uncharacterised protein [Prevotella disiens]
MKLIEYYLNIFHYVIYVYCIKYKRFLPGYSPSHNSGNILMILTVIPSIIIFNSYLLFYKVNNHPPIIELFLVITIPFYPQIRNLTFQRPSCVYTSSHY